LICSIQVRAITAAVEGHVVVGGRVGHRSGGQIDGAVLMELGDLLGEIVFIPVAHAGIPLHSRDVVHVIVSVIEALGAANQIVHDGGLAVDRVHRVRGGGRVIARGSGDVATWVVGIADYGRAAGQSRLDRSRQVAVVVTVIERGAARILDRRAIAVGIIRVSDGAMIRAVVQSGGRDPLFLGAQFVVVVIAENNGGVVIDDLQFARRGVVGGCLRAGAVTPAECGRAVAIVVAEGLDGAGAIGVGLDVAGEIVGGVLVPLRIGIKGGINHIRSPIHPIVLILVGVVVLVRIGGEIASRIVGHAARRAELGLLVVGVVGGRAGADSAT